MKRKLHSSVLTETVKNISQVEFDFELVEPSEAKSKKSAPAFTVTIGGIYLEGARWDPKKKLLAESHPKIHHDPLPLIRLCPRKKPTDETSDAKKNVYRCPVYRTQARTGILLPTGHSTNFIFCVDLPSDQPEEHWINRGVAGIAQKPD